MKALSSKIALVVIGVGGALLFFALHRGFADSSTVDPESVHSSGSFEEVALSRSAQSTVANVTGAEIREPIVEVGGRVDFRKAFKSSEDYFSFIQKALPFAEAGDSNAAYYMAAAIEYCDTSFRHYFAGRTKVLNVEESIAEFSKYPGSSMAEVIRLADARCARVYESGNAAQWGSSEAWIAKATDAGQPLAQVRTAADALLNMGQSGPDGALRMGKANEHINVPEATRLVRLAMETKDADVMLEASNLLGFLRPHVPPDEVSQEMLVWRYAACMRGADCSKDSDWMIEMCLYDPDCPARQDGIHHLRSAAMRDGMVNLESRANLLLSDWDAGRWSELGLDTP